MANLANSLKLFPESLVPDLTNLTRFISRPHRSVVEPSGNRSTVRHPKRKAYPDIYRNPSVIVDESAQRVRPENPLMRDLFGVGRHDLDDIARARYASGETLEPMPLYVPPKGGPEEMQNLFVPGNTQRAQDILSLAATDPRFAGNYGWYENQPLLDQFIAEWGVEEGTKRWDRFHQIGAAFSPGSPVPAEIRRSTIADTMSYQGKGAEFLDLMGKAKWESAGSPEGLRLPKGTGHMYHSSGHQKARPVLEETGDVVFDPLGSPKTGLYYGARTLRNMDLPPGDAHFGRYTGLSDVRNNVALKKDKITGRVSSTAGDSPGAGEYYPIQEWFRNEVAGPAGVPGVPAQALVWNAAGTSTGVTTPLGAPLMELLTNAIETRARQLRQSPVTVRDQWLKGKEHLWGAGALPVGLASEDAAREAYAKETPENAQAYNQAAWDRVREEGRFHSMPTRGMEASPDAPQWMGDTRRWLEGIQTGGGMADPEGIAEALRALEQGRTSSYVDNVSAAGELFDPMVWGAFLREVKNTMNSYR